MWPFSRSLSHAIYAECPNCHGTDLARLWTIVRSRYNGEREEAVPAGGRYLCERCGTQFDVTAKGVFRPFGATAQPPPNPTATAPPPTEKKPERKIPIRVPKA